MLRASRSANELRRRVYKILKRDTPGDWASTVVARFIVLLIVINLAAVVLESMPQLAARYALVFDVVEYVSLLVFTGK
jgi:voltage-gated potassium channel